MSGWASQWVTQHVKKRDWASSWPLSEQVAVDLVLPVDQHGDINLQAWTHAVDVGNGIAVQWWNAVVMGNDRWNPAGFHICPLLALVSGAIEKFQCKSLWRQLVWQLARKVEAQVEQARGGSKLNGGLQVEASTLTDLLDNVYQLDKHLHKYIESGKQAIGEATWWLSFMHDIGICNGLRLDAGAFITRQDVAIMSAPKACFCCCFLLLCPW